MDKYLKEYIAGVTPKMNPDVMNGLATKYLPKAEEYIDNVFKYAFSKTTDMCGLTYLGYERCTPREEFNESTKPRSGKRTVNLGDSYIFLVKYFFEFRDKVTGVVEPLPTVYLYIPFVGEAGAFYLGGSRYFIYPVLSNKVISATAKGIFVALLRDKINFTRMHHTYVVNGDREMGQIIRAPLYRKDKKKSTASATTKAEITNIHYLLTKNGFTEFYRKYFNVVPVAGNSKEITTDNYPRERWTIFESIRIKPRTCINVVYNPTNVRFAVENQYVTPELKNSIANVFYLIDNFPDRLNEKHLDNKNLWSILLGHIIFSGLHNEVKLYEDIKKHFASLDEYLDEIISIKLIEIGYPCNDFYDLLFLIHKNFSMWHSDTESINTMYGKELTILYNTLYHLITAIFTASFKVKSKVQSKPNATAAEITALLNKYIRKGAIFDNVKTSNSKIKNNNSSVQYSGDHKFFKITSTIIPQESRANTNGKGSINDPNNKLHPSYAECGGYLAISKTQPIGNGKINPYVMLDNKGTITRDPAKIELIERTKTLMFGQNGDFNATMFETEVIEILKDEDL